ncbi:hypothetical protein [Ornithinimicrobium cerasi]|uniref:hypothetical protein n=1 Tax=Ornithinimicrobium cerasi TaxID=2248773 RepID=UPI00137A1666|nr:hypothetical protein [Ornithinimicrobium cerasi]
MSTPTAPDSPGARVAARLIAERGPLPDHLITSIAARIRRSVTEHRATGRKPA